MAFFPLPFALSRLLSPLFPPLSSLRPLLPLLLALRAHALARAPPLYHTHPRHSLPHALLLGRRGREAKGLLSGVGRQQAERGPGDGGAAEEEARVWREAAVASVGRD